MKKNYLFYLHYLKLYFFVILTGIFAGFGAYFFKLLINFFHNIFFYGKFNLQYNILIHSPKSLFGIGIILVPMLGAILVAFLVKNFAPEAKGHGVPEVIDAIYYKKGKIRPIVALIKSLASSISIGSGGSVGREGPIIQIGSAFGSIVADHTKSSYFERITLIACGAGGGIAATFNAPFGGILFALEIMLPEISARTIIPISISTAVATYISYLFTGAMPFMPIVGTLLPTINISVISCYLFLSVLLGLVSYIFIYVIYWFEDKFDDFATNYYLRHVFGMFWVGLSLYLMFYFFGHYYLEGVGYATIYQILNQMITHPGFLFLLALLKIIDTALTLGSGGSGGIFSPLLFIGAALGAGFISFIEIMTNNHLFLSPVLGAFAGMAGMVGASTAAPLTAIIMTAELTNHFELLLPLMVIVAIAYAVRRTLLKESIYTLKLKRRGHAIPSYLHNQKKRIK